MSEPHTRGAGSPAPPVGEPAAREPTAQETVGQEAVEQGAVEQGTAPQEATESAGPDPGAERGELERGEPKEARPEAAGPQVAGPQVAGPQAAGPQAAGPEAAGPEAAGPQDAEEDDESPKPLGPVANTAVALTVIALGLAGAAGSWALGPGTPADPGSGTWPLLVSVAITALGVVLLGLARRTADTEVFSRSSWKVLVGVATMVGFVAVVGVIGFEIPSALLAFVWLRFLGGESWRLSAIASVLIVVAFYTVFVGLLSVPIPHLF